MKLSRLRSLMSLLTAMGMLPNQGTWKLEKEGEGLAREQKDGPRPWGKAWEPTSTQRCPGTPSSREGTHPNIQVLGTRGGGCSPQAPCPFWGDSRGAAGSEHPPDLLGLLAQVPAVQAHPDGAVAQLVQGQRHGAEIGQAAPGEDEEKD